MSTTPLTTIQLKVIADLKRFVPVNKRAKMFKHIVRGHPSIKDTIEAIGIPHTEIKAIRVDGFFVNFHYQLQGGERIRVYPHRYPISAKIVPLRPPLAKVIKFICDVHLGKLAHYLRLLGFDTYYNQHLQDNQIIRIGLQQHRIILTRDIGLLKNKKVTFGHFVHHTAVHQQIKEIITRYTLANKCRPFSRCLECNGRIDRVPKKNIAHLLPPKTQQYYRLFYQCQGCKRVYWQGAHYQNLIRKVHRCI